jgi:hypothetical protein
MCAKSQDLTCALSPFKPHGETIREDLNMDQKFYTYRGYPLVRKKDTIYYGYMSDPFVVMMQIMSVKKTENGDIADKIKVYQMSTDPSVDPIKAFVKNTERDSLYDALDLAAAWLQRA